MRWSAYCALMTTEVNILESPLETYSQEVGSTQQTTDIFHHEASEHYAPGGGTNVQGQGDHQDQGLPDQAGQGGCLNQEKPGASSKWKD